MSVTFYLILLPSHYWRIFTVASGLFFFFASGFAQNTTPHILPEQALIDSLSTVARQQPRKGLLVLDSLLAKYRATSDSMAVVHTLAQIAHMQRRSGMDEQSRATFTEAVRMSPKTLHWQTRARLSDEKAISAGWAHDVDAFEEAMIAYDAAVKGQDDTTWMLRNETMKSFLLSSQGKPSDALAKLYELEEIALKFKDPERIRGVYTFLSWVHSTRGDAKAARKADYKAFRYSDIARYPLQRIWWHKARMGHLMSDKKYDKALVQIDSAISLTQELDLNAKRLILWYDKAQILMQLERYSEALVEFQALEQAYRAIDIDPSPVMYSIGVCYRGLDRFDLAGPQMIAGYHEASQRGFAQGAQFMAYAAYETYFWKGKNEQALHWYKRHVEIRDSLKLLEQKADEAVILAKMEAREKELQLEQSTNLAQRAEARNKLLSLSIGALLLLLGISFYAFRQRQALQEARIHEATRKGEALEVAVHQKNEQLNVQALTLAQKNALLSSLQNELNSANSGAKGEIDRKMVSRLSRSIAADITTGEDWEVFTSTMVELQSEFFSELGRRHPDLTANDKRLVSMLRLNMSSKEIGRALSISPAGVKKARYRLRKKLALETGEKIGIYLQRIESEASPEHSDN